MIIGRYYDVPILDRAGLCISINACAASFADSDGVFSIGRALYDQASEIAVMPAECHEVSYA